MSQNPRRPCGQLQPIAPGPFQDPLFEDGGASGMLTDMEIGVKAGATSKTGSKSSTKRQAVTSVACGYCQRQKSKCDGLRPMCGPCGRRGRTDCGYELPRDQRRSTFMRERNVDLERETSDLKDIIRSMCLAEDPEAAIEMARIVVATGFEKVQVQKVAQMLNSLPPEVPNPASHGFGRSSGGLELQSLRYPTDSMPLPHGMTPSSDRLQLPRPYPTVMPPQGHMPFQVSNTNYALHAAPSSSSAGEYWLSPMDSSFSAQDFDPPGWS